MDLQSELQEFDGKDTGVLESLASRLTPTAEVIDELCAFVEDGEPRIQVGATWLLKRFAERGTEVSGAQQSALIELVDRLSPWEARLHLLQLLRFFSVSKAQKASLFGALTESTRDDNTFVRAWAFNGLVILADQHAELRPRVRERIEKAEQDESASVKARIRNARKGCDWL